MNEKETTPLTDSELKKGYWIVTHKDVLRRDVRIAAYCFDGILVIIALTLAVSAVLQFVQIRQIEQELAVPLQITNRVLPKQPVIITATAVPLDAKSINVVVHMQNPNDIWAAENIEYELIVGNNTIPTAPQNLAPSQEKVFVAQNVAFSQGNLPSVRVTIQKIAWKKKRLSQLAAVNWQFGSVTVEGITVSSSQTGASSQQVDAVDGASGPISTADVTTSNTSRDAVQTQLAVTVRNGSVFGFREPEVVAVLKNASGTIVGVNRIVLESIRSLEERPMTFNFSARPENGMVPTMYVNVDLLNEQRIIRTLPE